MHGQVDHLITSAGFTENYPAETYPHERVRKLWGVNVDGTYLAAVAVAKHLMERKARGSLILIGSMSGAIVNVPQPQAPYNASKAAVRQLAASLAVEWAPHGIRVNCISPGYMETALYACLATHEPHPCISPLQPTTHPAQAASSNAHQRLPPHLSSSPMILRTSSDHVPASNPPLSSSDITHHSAKQTTRPTDQVRRH